jgi:hypothetical protein
VGVRVSDAYRSAMFGVGMITRVHNADADADQRLLLGQYTGLDDGAKCLGQRVGDGRQRYADARVQQQRAAFDAQHTSRATRAKVLLDHIATSLHIV